MTLVEVYAGQRSVAFELIAFCCPAKEFLVQLVILYKGPVNCHDVNYT